MFQVRIFYKKIVLSKKMHFLDTFGAIKENFIQFIFDNYYLKILYINSSITYSIITLNFY